MIFVAEAKYRRDIEIFHTNSARSETFLEWLDLQLAYVSRSISRHFPDLVGFQSKISKVGVEMWPDEPCKKSPGAGVAMRGSVLARGFG